MTNRQENALKTRQKLLDVTHNLIKQKGFYKLNIEDITQSAGVAKGTFYTYFKHKEEIVLEICKGLFKQTQSKLEQLKNSNISERLFCYFECFIK
ncbi:TetR/AcrR family transcriptional regulator, partial [bacterium]|nr:TetR/AcrR family transcriptional regulator [bacterium]